MAQPVPLEQQAQMAQMREAGAKHVAMEVSSHALMQHRVSGIDFSAAVFTNLTRDHLDYHGSMMAYARAKARLFQRHCSGPALINIDDAFGRVLWRRLSRKLDCVSYIWQATLLLEILKLITLRNPVLFTMCFTQQQYFLCALMITIRQHFNPTIICVIFVSLSYLFL